MKGKRDSKGNRWRAPASDWDNKWNEWPNQDPGKWTPPTKGGKGKGKDDKRFDPQSLWCEIHQTYGHSTDWCYENPNRTGGPPRNHESLWCETCNRPGHVSTSCYATSIRTKGKGGTVKGKGNSGDRNWKNQNFPAGYNSDQATPALHEESSPSSKQVWWDDELGSAIFDDDNRPLPVPLHTSLLDDYVMHNSYDENDDEYTADYIDLILFAIITNVERQKTYRLNPTVALQNEIREHSISITSAENCLNEHIQRIIRNFKTSINYDALMSTLHTDEPNDEKLTRIECTQVEIDADAMSTNVYIEYTTDNALTAMNAVDIAKQNTNEIEMKSNMK
jgi:hypothetical protein